MANRSLWRGLGDLRSLESEPSHQAFLAEDKRIDIVPQGCARHRFRLALVHNDDTRADADLLAVTLVQIRERLVVHQKQRITKLLHAGLQAEGSRHGVVVPYNLVPLHEGPIALDCTRSPGLGEIRLERAVEAQARPPAVCQT